MQTRYSKVQCGSVIGAICVILCAQAVPYGAASLADSGYSIVSDGYDFDDYVPAHQNRPDGPWIVSSYPSSDYAEKPFRSAINVDYSTLDTSSANHHGNINHINNQFGSTFIPDIVDNSHLNSHPIRMLCVPNHNHRMKCIDAVSGGPKPPKAYNGYLKHTIRSVHGPFNSNVPARSSFSRPRRIYHVPVVKRPTIRDIHNSAVKKISPFYMEKFAEPSLHPSDKIMFSVYKKKRRIFTRSN